VSSDLVLEVLEAGLPEDIPEQQVVTKVRAVDALDGDMIRLHLQTPRSNRLRFLAGQRVTLGFRPALRAARSSCRAFPVASCPCDDRNLIFHVPPGADDFSQCLFAGRIKPGAEVSVRGPWGRFVLEPDSIAAAGFCCDRPRLRADQQPDRTCHRGRCRRIDHALLGSLTTRWPVPAQPVPRLGRRSTSFTIDRLTSRPSLLPLAADAGLAESKYILPARPTLVDALATVLRGHGLAARLHVEAL
jgi:hypothetical protein